MNSNLTKKLKLIFVPFLITMLGFCIIYTFLNWLLLIKLQLFSVKETIVNFVIPLMFPVIPIIFYLHKRLSILNLKAKNGKTYTDFYIFILWLSISVPTIIAQDYLKTATGKLTQVENVSAISKQEQTKYYKIDRLFIDKSKACSHTLFELSGKNDINFNMYIYVVVPVFDKKYDASNATSCKYWLGVRYHNQVSNNLSQSRKESEYQTFANFSETEFNKTDLNDFVYLERVGNSDSGDGYKEALKNSTKLNTTDSTIFIASKEPFENRNGNSFLWFICTLLGGIVISLIAILIPKFNPRELKNLESGKPQENKDLKEFLEFIKPREGYFVTPILIYLNIAIFLVMFLSGLGFVSFGGQDLLNWGANYQPYTTNGQWWRLITSVFLHGGFMHLLSNMFGLLFVGLFLEPLLGREKYLTIYLITGTIASLASIWWHDATISVGASGAIFGLYGLFLSLLLTKVFPPQINNVFLVTTLIFIGYNLVMGLTGGIDNAAHIGGLISGFVIGLIMSNSLKSEEQRVTKRKN
ncbi:rhomboid family intramembrane serine protease [Flavobacterium sp. KMS]|uniref:rhomboid family intramembrane serine protease n=1 Tax=Flavobacterium sp. KMS TaxID=1566023 RepID=UPI0009DF483E|nr:rhomboid family intramembrane serine protease [Flavobacterium sp. KMS]